MDLEALRDRLRRMINSDLLHFGQAARYMCSPFTQARADTATEPQMQHESHHGPKPPGSRLRARVAHGTPATGVHSPRTYGRRPGLFVALIVVAIVVVVAVFVVVLDSVLVDRNTAVHAAADQLAHGGAAGPSGGVLVAQRNRGGRRRVGFWHENQVSLRVGRHQCEPDDVGMVSIKTLVPSTTPSTEPLPSGDPAGLIAPLAPR